MGGRPLLFSYTGGRLAIKIRDWILARQLINTENQTSHFHLKIPYHSTQRDHVKRTPFTQFKKKALAIIYLIYPVRYSNRYVGDLEYQ
jgi:hypothetical protein